MDFPEKEKKGKSFQTDFKEGAETAAVHKALLVDRKNKRGEIFEYWHLQCIKRNNK